MPAIAGQMKRCFYNGLEYRKKNDDQTPPKVGPNGELLTRTLIKNSKEGFELYINGWTKNQRAA